MSDAPVIIGMTPSHPGDFIRAEILDEFGLNVSQAAEVLGVRRATLSDLVNGKAVLSPEMALRIEGLWRGYGNAAADASVVRHDRDAPARGRDHGRALPAASNGAALRRRLPGSSAATT